MGVKQSVLLIQPPFTSLFEPSCALGRLKACLSSMGIACDCLYTNLELAASLNEKLRNWMILTSNDSYFAELIYSSETFPDHLSRNAFLHQMLAHYRRDIDNPKLFQELFHCVRRFNRRLLARWKNNFPYTIVGISANFNLMPSLYFGRALKYIHPRVETVLGGSECVGEVGHAIARTFSFLDWVVDGEGEETLLEITRILEKRSDEVPSSTSRRINGRVIHNATSRKLVNITKLPFPNYDDYFNSASLKKIGGSVAVPVEAGRGCWWGKCAFCNVPCHANHSYRRMSDERIVETMEYLAERHKYLDFRFVDSIQPTNLVSLANALIKSPFDFNFFMSLNATISIKHLELLAKSGLNSVQIGVESFSDNILKKMNKAPTVMNNILVLKAAKQLGIEASFVIISPYLGEAKSDIVENCDVIRNISHLITGKIQQVRFILKYGSAIYCAPYRYGIKKISPSIFYKVILPSRWRFEPTLFWDYSPKKRIRNIVSTMPQTEYGGSLEMFVGRGKFCVVKDRRSAGRTKNDYVITAPHSDILLACDTPKRRYELKYKRKVLDDLTNLGFLAESSGMYLTIATRDKK